MRTRAPKVSKPSPFFYLTNNNLFFDLNVPQEGVPA